MDFLKLIDLIWHVAGDSVSTVGLHWHNYFEYRPEGQSSLVIGCIEIF